LFTEDNIPVGLDLASVGEVDPVKARMNFVSHKDTLDDSGLEFLSEFKVQNGIAGTAKDLEV
jgi:hypothetical protein